MRKIFILITSLLIMVTNAIAENRIVNLTVEYKTVNFAGKHVKAIAVNNQIPSPTLHFKQGDRVTINVHNKLDKETAIHWHGIILPWQMDGVLGVTQQGIQPGETFHYQFTLRQSGTYWYHAHAELQEQQGLYGAFLVDPLKPAPYKYTKDYVVVLSDWSNTHPDKILANLKKTGDYYAPRFPLQPSLVKFISDYRKASVSEKLNLVNDYKTMQNMRMSIYDLSDIAYDAFLLNGKPNSSPWQAPVKVGDIVRLRFIGAGGGTIFHVKIPNTTMQMVHVEGNNVKPYTLSDFTISPGETYDVLVRIQKNEPYIIYAESIDTVGAAYGALVTSPNQMVGYSHITPFKEPLPVTRDMRTLMMGSKYQGVLPNQQNDNKAADSKVGRHNHTSKMPNSPGQSMGTMNHKMTSAKSSTMTSMNNDHKPKPSMSGMSGHTDMGHTMTMSMPTEPTIIGDTLSPPNPHFMTSIGTKYKNLKAAVITNNPNKPIAGIINMQLFGYMDRYIWFINGVRGDKAKPIIFEPGKRYRIVFTNTSMMRHPMHIHGHWFILRKGNGKYDPLLHTIEVEPGATITADIDADVSGQWFFHCHLLYHMMTGMSRVFQYSTLIEIIENKIKPEDIVKKTPYVNRPIVRVDEVRPIDKALVLHPMGHNIGLWLATYLDVMTDPFSNIQSITYKGLYGTDYNKLELFANDAEINKGKVDNADIDINYWHLISQFWAVKAGVNYFYRPASNPYWQPTLGVEGLMPYFIDTDVRAYYYSGSAKLDIELSRDTQITNNFFMKLGIRSVVASKTLESAEIGHGLNRVYYTIRPYYRLMPGLSILAEFERETAYGVYRDIQRSAGEPASRNTYSLGLSILL